ncbi:MAG: ACT domain-containing protein [Dehalococcoidia bacterium]|nr:ACT domain-containing protein [Dehalococcoidia bacterium]
MTTVRQISMTLENEPGQFLRVSEFLGYEGINIRALAAGDLSDVSNVRFITDNPDKTLNVLKSRGYTVRERDVIAVEVPDHPGALQAVLKPLANAGINIQSIYTYLGRGESGQPIVILSVDKIEETLKVLKKNWVTTYGRELYAL